MADDRRCVRARRGSTSTRRRPAGRGAAARASHRTAWSGARTQPAAVGRARGPPRRRRRARAVDEGGGGRRPETAARAVSGGKAQRGPAGGLGHREAGRVGVDGGVEHLVAGQAGLDEDAARRPRRGRPTSRAARASRARACLAGAVAGGEQLLVEVEEGHRVGRRPPGGARPRCRPGRRRPARPAAVARGHLGHRPAGQQLQLLAGPGDAHPERLQPGRAARGADRGAGRPAAPAGTAPSVRPRRPPARARLAAGQLPAGAARQQPGPALAVEHAHHPAGRRRASRTRVDQPGRVEARPGRLVAGGRRPRRRASRPAPRCATAPAAAPGQASASSDGRGRGEHARHPGPPGPLDGDVAGVPRRRPLLLVGLVVLVEHEDRAQLGGGAPTPRPGRRPPRTRRPRPGPTPGAVAPPARPGGRRPGGEEARRPTATGPGPGRRPGPAASRARAARSSAGGVRTTTTPAGRGLGGQRPAATPRVSPRSGRRAASRPAPHRRRGRPEEARAAARPTARPPTGQVDQRRPAAPSR